MAVASPSITSPPSRLKHFVENLTLRHNQSELKNPEKKKLNLDANTNSGIQGNLHISRLQVFPNTKGERRVKQSDSIKVAKIDESTGLTKFEAMVLGNKDATSIPGTSLSLNPASFAHSESKCKGLVSWLSFEYSTTSASVNTRACFKTSPHLSKLVAAHEEKPQEVET
nr:hypothetical protein Iba_chr07bCG4700 [Ipomoea batatas]